MCGRCTQYKFCDVWDSKLSFSSRTTFWITFLRRRMIFLLICLSDLEKLFLLLLYSCVEKSRENLVIVGSPHLEGPSHDCLAISATSRNNETSEADKRRVLSGQSFMDHRSRELGYAPWRKIYSQVKWTLQKFMPSPTRCWRSSYLPLVSSVLSLIAEKDCQELWKLIVKCAFVMKKWAMTTTLFASIPFQIDTISIHRKGWVLCPVLPGWQILKSLLGFSNYFSPSHFSSYNLSSHRSILVISLLLSHLIFFCLGQQQIWSDLKAVACIYITAALTDQETGVESGNCWCLNLVHIFMCVMAYKYSVS